MTRTLAPAVSPDPAMRRNLGAFYTPADLARVLVRWAVRDKNAKLIDPSAGGGVFLDAAFEEFVLLGSSTPGASMSGIELDHATAELLLARFAGIVPADNLIHADFFDVTAAETGRFDVVVGNPPYVRHHLLAEGSRKLARLRSSDAGIALNDQADAWTYFVAHSLAFMTTNGRAAFVLPGSVLQADYAAPLLEALSRFGGRSELIRVQTLLFDSVQERTVVLTIDRSAPDGPLGYREVRDVAELQQVLERDRRGVENGPASFGSSHEERLAALLPPDARSLWEDICRVGAVRSLGELATIKIGSVTGANGFFLRSASDIGRLVPEADRRADISVVGRSGWLRGLSWSAEDVADVARLPSRLLALPSDHKPGTALRREIKAAELAGISERSHCAKRSPWWSLRDVEAPDLFLPYMGGSAPRLVRNDAGSTCTNAVHRVRLETSGASASALAASSWTSLYRLGAELAGRQYAGGVLKLELREARRLIVVPFDEADAQQAASKIESALASSSADVASKVADQAVLLEHLGLDQSDLKLLRQAAEQLARRRKTKRLLS